MRLDPFRPEERGTALLSVLLLVALIAVIAANALERSRLATRLGANGAAIEQARAYAMAAEVMATTRLSALLTQNPTRVTLDGDWSGKPFSLPVPGGIATARVVDGGNCFNLNALVQRLPDGTLVARPAAAEQFARLMRYVGIPGSEAQGLAAAATDWIDSDGDTLPGGAEDPSYSGQRPPYRTANTLMADVSELRALIGMTPQLYEKLRPWVCALPRAAYSRINVNTLLPEQAPLLAALLPDTLDPARARGFIAQRPPLGFASTFAFWQGPAAQGIVGGPAAEEQTAVTTVWFNLRIDVTVGGRQLSETALIDATELPARLATRAWEDPS